MFLVAGPALGYTVRQLHRYAYSIYDWIISKITKKTDEREDVYEYAEVRSSAEEKLELDEAESAYDFSISTPVILLLIGLYYLFFMKPNTIIVIAIFVLGSILLMGGVMERKENYGPIYNSICNKHNIRCSTQ